MDRLNQYSTNVEKNIVSLYRYDCIIILVIFFYSL